MNYEWIVFLSIFAGLSLLFMALCVAELVMDHYWPLDDGSKRIEFKVTVTPREPAEDDQ